MFEQMMIQQQELYRQAQENRQKMIDQKYPVNFVIGHSVLLAAVCFFCTADYDDYKSKPVILYWDWYLGCWFLHNPHFFRTNLE